MQAGMTRRELLATGAATGVLALEADPLIRRALAARSHPGTLSDIEHVVILIQENRSFDHYFGTLPGVRGFADAAPAVLAQGGYPAPGYEGELLPFHLETGGMPQCFPDITHKWVPQHQSWDGGAMDGFVRAHLAFDGPDAGPATMGYYERADIPFYYALAEAFTICENYHCSMLGPTDPNRLYSMSASIDPDGEAGGPLVETQSFEARAALAGRFTWATMPEQLSAAGVSWKIYTGAERGVEDNVLSYFRNYQTNAELAELAFEALYPCDFSADLANDELPQVSWILASFEDTEHPGFSTAAAGEYTVEKLVKRLFHHPERVGEHGAVPHVGRERRLLRPRGPAGRTRRHARRVPHRARHHGRLRRHRRSHRARLQGADARRLAVQPRRLPVPGRVRPHLHPAVPGGPVRRRGAEPERMAAGSHRRPDERVQLRRAGQEQAEAPGDRTHPSPTPERRLRELRLGDRAAQLPPGRGRPRMADAERAIEAGS